MNTSERDQPANRVGSFLYRASLRSGRFRRFLWCTFGLVLGIFAGYEILERTVLAGADVQVLHLFHLARGLVSCVVVALVLSWGIIKTSPGFLAASPAGEDWSPASQPTMEERTKIYAQWFIAMRWIAALVAGLLVLITVEVAHWLPTVVWWPLILTVVGLGAVNSIYALLVHYNRGCLFLLRIQGYIDLGILTLLLHFSGGIENPLSAMMIFHVIIAGMVLSQRQCYGIAVAASGLFALLAWAEWTELVPHYTLQLLPHLELTGGGLLYPSKDTLYATGRVVLQFVVLLLTAYFVTSLAERLRQNERRLEAMAGRALAGQQLLEQALETSGAGLRVLDRNLKSYWTNTRWNKWFVCPPGRSCRATELLDRPEAPASLTLKDGQLRVTELALVAGDCGSLTRGESNQRVFQVTTAPLRDVNGHIHQVVEFAQDITQQKKTQAQMLRAGSLAAVGELAGRVAHEVNNPIAIISAKARLLLSDHRGEMSPKIAQELAKITDLSDRVARLAQGLLSYCRPSPSTRVRLDIRLPIRKSLAMVEQHARHSRVRVEDALPATTLLVYANASELQQVFLNLFLNALDAMPQGGTLNVSAAPAGVTLGDGRPATAVTVADTGIGIAEAARDRIFEPFFTTKQDGRGTGLGLSICLGLLRSQGGDLEVQSEVGKGSRFIVKLPTYDADGKADNRD